MNNIELQNPGQILGGKNLAGGKYRKWPLYSSSGLIVSASDTYKLLSMIHCLQ